MQLVSLTGPDDPRVSAVRAGPEELPEVSSPHTDATSRCIATTRFARNANTASTARCFAPPTTSDWPSRQTSNGPNTRTCTDPTRRLPSTDVITNAELGQSLSPPSTGHTRAQVVEATQPHRAPR